MPRCKVCKIKFEPKFFNQKVCLNAECVLKHSKEVKAKEWAKRKKVKKIVLNVKKNKSYLQDEINKLARKIDSYFEYDCVCCGKPFQGQIDGAHFHNVGGNENIRFNLHNIHAARGFCNKHDVGNHKANYPTGLTERYGKEYFDMVNGLGLEYKYLGLTEVEVHEKLKVVRKINREFDQMIKGNDVDGSMARSYFNGLIGIYK